MSAAVLSGPHIEFLVERTRTMRAAREASGAAWPPEDDAFCPLLEIEPFDPTLAGPNSYDVHLGDTLRVYGHNAYLGYYEDWAHPVVRVEDPPKYLDPAKENPTCQVHMPPGGVVLLPGCGYLGTTAERTWCAGLVPWTDGRSSVGRLFVQVHQTAGRGDDNFDGRWTLEIAVTHPVRVWPGMRIAQVTFFTLLGKRRPYKGKYQNQQEPVGSRIHMDQEEKPCP